MRPPRSRVPSPAARVRWPRDASSPTPSKRGRSPSNPWSRGPNNRAARSSGGPQALASCPASCRKPWS
eukprot:2883903-Alexandrium_andersonii.AAC.1